jgi:very-short-patch-repair endonuclease
MNLPTFTDPFIERPLQRRSAESQLREMGIDPASRSPLEQDMGRAILGLLLDPDEFGPPDFINLFLPHGTCASMEDFPPILPVRNGVINVTAGCWLANYQADFLFCVKAPGRTVESWGALECDGHEFHDATPDQAAHDRARDRAFQALGVAILRFTGREIIADPRACARESINILIKLSAAKKSEAA